MALDTAFWPLETANGVLVRMATLAARNIRTTVVVSLILICGSFAAAAALQMRLDRVHALNQARYFEARRAHALAAVTGAALDRIAGLGHAFATGAAVTVPGSGEPAWRPIHLSRTSGSVRKRSWKCAKA